MKTVAVLGGTFNPVHNGHLFLASRLKHVCQFDEMYLLPCHIPPHKEVYGVSAQLRVQMLQQAVSQFPELCIDLREVNRESVSYTIDTLIELRREIGPDVSITWIMGMDSLCNLSTWHRWLELLDYAHIMVLARDGYECPQSGGVGQWLQDKVVSPGQLRQSAYGAVAIAPVSPIRVSSTYIRQCIEKGNSVEHLLPDVVWRFICDKGIYQAAQK